MLIIDDYAIEQLFTQNRIIIYLPSLFHTTNSTMEKISWTRKERLTREELATVLQLVMSMFEEENEISVMPVSDNSTIPLDYLGERK